MGQRCFTPTQVNRVIPELERIVRYVRSLEGDLRELEWRLKQAQVEARREGPVGTDAFWRQEAEIDFLRILVRCEFDRVRELGGEIKGGLMVDFPGRIDGCDVLLCWKPGESRVAWYHGVCEGATGRKPIPEQYLSPVDEPEEH